MDVSEAKDRMLEVENLTDALEDDDANWLLDWGIDKVGPLIQGIADDDQAGEKVNQLMGVMRSVNRITGDRSAAPPDELADDVRQLVEKYNAAFGANVSLSDEQVTALVGRIAKLGERDTMQALLDAATQPAGGAAASSSPTSAPQEKPAAAPSASNALAAEAPKSAEASPSATNAASAPGQAAAQPNTAQQATPPATQSEAGKQESQQGDHKTDASGQEESHA